MVHPDLHKGAPYKGLIEAKSKSGGRNNAGRITTRHVGGGHKQKYRVIDFRRNDKDGVKATVERLEYDPNRTANIALLKYSDGERRYVIAPKNLQQETWFKQEKIPQSALAIACRLEISPWVASFTAWS